MICRQGSQCELCALSGAHRYCFMGLDKVGKTWTALSLFNSKHVDPHRVIYVDNHGSTKGRRVHPFTAAEPWGLKVITKLDELKTLADTIRGAAARNRPICDAIVVDDISEQALINIAGLRQAGGTAIKNWGTHLEQMVDCLRMLDSDHTGAHLILIARAAWKADPTQQKPAVGVGYEADTRDQLLQPHLQGAVGSWLPHLVDSTIYFHKEVKRNKVEFSALLTPKGDTLAIGRWYHHWAADPELPKEIVDPSFDKIYELLAGLESREELIGA